MSQSSPSSSPAWGTNAKLVVALTIVVIVGALLVKFQFVITPLVIAFMMAYLLHPVASFLQQKAHFSWGAAVGLIYFIILLLLLGLLTAGGVGLVQQIQSLIAVLQKALANLPQYLETVSNKVYEFGPFVLDFRALDLNALSSQILGMVQPLLSQTGSLLSALAGSAANFVGLTFFVILVSYFMLAESRGFRKQIVPLHFPAYTQDFERLAFRLGRIWNAFLRGQIIIFMLAVAAYSAVFSLLGLSYAVGLAFVAGLARFVPYVGQGVTWVILVLVSYFQPFKLFGLSPLHYTLAVMLVVFIIDQIFDNILSPRILSDALKVHPAAVLVSAIIAANLFGLLGVFAAAPLLATAALLWNYVMRKLLDLDPWSAEETSDPPPSPPGGGALALLSRFFRWLDSKRKDWRAQPQKGESHER